MAGDVALVPLLLGLGIDELSAAATLVPACQARRAKPEHSRMPRMVEETFGLDIYLNMGHGPHIFTDATQNKLIISAFRWVITSDKKGNVIDR